ncbi:MAG: site-specific integrase [Planctomycetes bacterium]|nr:site-specific integrase [Planctomycetota bacterium]
MPIMNKKKTGRPTKYNDKLADIICHRMIEGESLRQICDDSTMPCKASVLTWLRKYPAFLTQTFILLGVTTGLRKSEMLHLMWTDLPGDADLQNGSVAVCPKRAGKFTVGGREYPILPWDVKDHERRDIPTLPPDAVKLLIQLKGKNVGSPYVFLGLDRLARLDIRIQAGTLRAKYEAAGNILKPFRDIQKAARLKLAAKRDVSPDKVVWPLGRIHDLRATFGTETALDVPVFTLCEWMGHSDPKTTAKFYVKTMKTTVDAARRAMASRYGQIENADRILTGSGSNHVLGVANSTENPVIDRISA